MQELRKHWWLFLALAICGIAATARSGMLVTNWRQLLEDRDEYVTIGHNVARRGVFAWGHEPYSHLTAYRPPLFPLLVAAVFWWHGSAFHLGIIHVILGTLAVGLTFRVGYLLKLRLGAAIAAGLVAIDPLLLQSTVLAMTETLCATLVIVWCWVLMEFPSWKAGATVPRIWPALLHGICFGLICLCRPGFLAALGLLGVWGIAAIACKWRSLFAQSEFRGQFLAALWSMVGVAIMLSPWVVRNAIVIGKATPATTHGGYTLLLGNNPIYYHEVVAQPWGTVWGGDSLNEWQTRLEMQMRSEGIGRNDEVSRDRWMYRQAWSHILAEPTLFARACLQRGLRFWGLAPWVTPPGYSRFLFWGTAIFYGLVTCGMLIGLARLTSLEWSTWSLLLLLPLTLWLTHLVYWTDMRMRAPVIPILALLAARAIKSPTPKTR